MSADIERISEVFEDYDQPFYVHDYLDYEILSTSLPVHCEANLTVWLRFIAFPDDTVIAFTGKVLRQRVLKEQSDRTNALLSFLNASPRFMTYHIGDDGFLKMMYCLPQVAADEMGEIAYEVVRDTKKHLESEYVLLNRTIKTKEDLLFFPDQDSLTLSKLDAFAKEKVSEDQDREEDIEEYNERRKSLLEKWEQDLPETEDENHCRFCKKALPYREYRFCPRCGKRCADENVQTDDFSDNVGKNAEWHPGYTEEGGMSLTCSSCRHIRKDMSIENDYNYCEKCGAAMVNAERFILCVCQSKSEPLAN